MNLRLAWAFFKRDAAIAISYRTSFAVTLIGNLVALIVCYYIGEMIGGQEIPALQKYGGSYLAFLLIGISLTDSVAISLTTFASQIREGQTTGSLEATLMSPVPLPAILVYSSLWSYFLSAIRFMIYLVLGVLIYGVGMEKANVGAAIAVFVMTVASFAGIGMLWASTVMLIKRGESMMNLAGAAMVLLGGVLFPVSILPGWLQHATDFIPLTHGLEGMRFALLQGYGLGDMLPVVWKLLAFTVVLIGAGIAAFNFAVWACKQHGSLSQF
jgi:ABC-2 type transport system permease protein